MIDTEARAAKQPPILEAKHVSKRFEDGKVLAVDDVSFRIPTGRFVALVGKSGCGKSTLLNLLGGLEVPTSGQVLFEGEDLSCWRDAAQFRSQKLGFVFQSFHLVSVLTAEQNVQLPMFESSLSSKERTAKSRQLLEWVGVSNRSRHLTSKLSGGERQRVAIARALANDPPLILADEPTGNLDTRTAADIMQLFERLHQSGKTILMVTHDTSLATQAEETIVMSDGKIDTVERTSGAVNQNES